MPKQWITAADLDSPTAESAESAAAYASYVLYHLSGKRYTGTTQSTDWITFSYDYPDYVEDFGAALNILGVSITNAQHITVYENDDARPLKLYLRSKPILSVSAVALGAHGATTLLDPSEYVIGNKAFLLRRDGQRWDLEHGIGVTYQHGVKPPEAGIMAAKELANELVLLETNPDACSLPSRITSISRQGVSYTVFDPQSFLDKGRTGLYNVDLFLSATNPSGAVKKAKVFSPDIPRGVRITNN